MTADGRFDRVYGMQSTIEQKQATTRSGERAARWTPLLLVGGLVLAFLAAPWSLERKALAALHGLCAQNPSHTFLMGGRPLPFDARMTGIYGGFAIAFVCLAVMGRHRAARLPTLPLMALLAGFVAVLAVDGFNSLFLDLGRPHLYQPDNRLRLLTGIATGIALAVILCFLIGVTLWRRPDAKQSVLIWRDLIVVLPAQLPFALLVVSGWGWLSAPLTVGLVLAAVAVLSVLALVAIVLIKRLDYTFDGAGDLHAHATAAIVVAVAIMGVLASGRFLLEHMTGIQTLP